MGLFKRFFFTLEYWCRLVYSRIRKFWAQNTYTWDFFNFNFDQTTQLPTQPSINIYKVSQQKFTVLSFIHFYWKGSESYSSKSSESPYTYSSQADVSIDCVNCYAYLTASFHFEVNHYRFSSLHHFLKEILPYWLFVCLLAYLFIILMWLIFLRRLNLKLELNILLFWSGITCNYFLKICLYFI